MCQNAKFESKEIQIFSLEKLERKNILLCINWEAHGL